MLPSRPSSPPLSLREWQGLAADHRKKIEEVSLPMRARRSRQERHPVYDFLHSYYSFPLGRLEQWHPGVGIALEDEEGLDFPNRYYQRDGGFVWIDPSKLTSEGKGRLEWIHQLLTLTQDRPPNLACHGLHEWAMVYSGAEVRHRENAPLRLPQEEIDALVASRPICCSHYDAFRFFAPDAAALNRLSPTLQSRQENEQPGCIHVNMDLYKWAYKSSPWISSELLGRTLFFAIQAREIDMRASPYDLSSYGYEAIAIETPEGRLSYEKAQFDLFQQGRELRAELLIALRQTLKA